MGMFINALKDRLRRRNLVFRIIESSVGILIAIGVTYGWGLPIGVIVGVMGEFLVYEFILEPAGLAGPYWERGPRDGERFTYP